jgi:phosphoglycolate phosphatase
MLQVLMQTFAVTPERTLMIGDTTHDVAMAHAAGVAALAVSYGAHEPDKLLAAGPGACAHSFAEVMAWLQAHA